MCSCSILSAIVLDRQRLPNFSHAPGEGCDAGSANCGSELDWDGCGSDTITSCSTECQPPLPTGPPSGRFFGSCVSSQDSYDVTAFQSLDDPTLWIFAVHDHVYTKMVGVHESERPSSTPSQCDNAHVDGHQPIDAASVTALWATSTAEDHTHTVDGCNTCYQIDSLVWPQ
jgi:hypothetical protein